MPAPIIDVTIPGCPTSQRSQIVRVGKFSRLGHDAPTAEWRSIARLTIAEVWGEQPAVKTSVLLTIWAVGKRPRNVPKHLGTGRYWRTTKPDWDNVGKASDALVKVGVIRDDVLVGTAIVYSLVAAEGENPHVRLKVEHLAPMDVVPHPPKPRKGSSNMAERFQ